MTEEQKLEHQKDKPDYGLESMDFKRKKSEELDQRISEKESMLADKQQELEGLTKDQQAVKTENRKLKEENREIKAEILSKKQKEILRYRLTSTGILLQRRSGWTWFWIKRKPYPGRRQSSGKNAPDWKRNGSSRSKSRWSFSN